MPDVRRKKYKKVINGVKVTRYEGDDFWVAEGTL